MLLLFVFIVVFIWLFNQLVFHRYQWPSYIKQINKIPGVDGLFFIGAAFQIMSAKEEELGHLIYGWFKSFGATYRVWVTGVALVCISETEDIQTILTSRSNFKKGLIYHYIAPWLGTGIITSQNPKWQKMRKIVTPTFHFSILRQYLEVFNKNTQTMLKAIKKEPNHESIDLHHFTVLCTLDIICETAMGISINAQTSKQNFGYVEAVGNMMHIVKRRAASPLYFSDFNLHFTSLGREQNRTLKLIHGFTDKIIQEKKKKLAEGSISDVKSCEKEESFAKVKCSFLDMLLELQKSNNLSDRDLREEVDTFLFAGHDTTSGCVSWAFFELGHAPDIQEEVFNELQQIFGDSDRDPTHDDLTQMTYLRRVILETLRLYPSAPVISREFNCDIQLKNYLVPANTEFLIFIPKIHRNPQYFPNPEAFNPDHFLPEAVEKRHPFAYIPFSAGQRNCIGQKFGMLEMLVMISTVLRKYKVVSLDKRDSIDVCPIVILRPNKKLHWKLIRR